MDCSMPGLPAPHYLSKVSQVDVCPAVSSSVTLFSFCPPSSPASRTFPMSQLLVSDDQTIGASASASVLPISIQSWFPFRLTGLVSLLSTGLSGVLSSTRVWKHQFLGVLPSLWSSSHNRTWPLGRPQPWLLRGLIFHVGMGTRKYCTDEVRVRWGGTERRDAGGTV